MKKITYFNSELVESIVEQELDAIRQPYIRNIPRNVVKENTRGRWWRSCELPNVLLPDANNGLHCDDNDDTWEEGIL